MVQGHAAYIVLDDDVCIYTVQNLTQPISNIMKQILQ